MSRRTGQAGCEMFGRKKKLSRTERNDKRDNISVGLQAASLMTSVATLGVTLGMMLNRKPGDDGEYEEPPVYYMSESMGLIRWERWNRGISAPRAGEAR